MAIIIIAKGFNRGVKAAKNKVRVDFRSCCLNLTFYFMKILL